MALRALFFSMCRVKWFSLLLPFPPSLPSFFFWQAGPPSRKQLMQNTRVIPPTHLPPSTTTSTTTTTTPPAIFSLWHSSHYLWDLVKPNLHVFVRPWVRFLLWLLCLSVARLRGVFFFFLFFFLTWSVQRAGDTWRGGLQCHLAGFFLKPELKLVTLFVLIAAKTLNRQVKGLNMIILLLYFTADAHMEQEKQHDFFSVSWNICQMKDTKLLELITVINGLIN